MKYTEWRDELKDNLLNVSEAERRRVLDYYAEAYADRRDAGFSEREIINDFGAPYDAAQRILYDSAEPDYEERPNRREQREEKREKRDYREYEPRRAERESDADYEKRGKDKATTPKKQSGGDMSWVFILLCVIFAIPLFSIIFSLVVTTVAFCAAPFGILVASVAVIGAGVGTLFSSISEGLLQIATGIMLFGISLIIMPLFFKLIKLIWKLFQTVLSWIKGLFVKKESAI